MSVHPLESEIHCESEVVGPLDPSALRRTFHSVFTTGGRATQIRETIRDHLTPWSFIGEMESAFYLLCCAWLPCALLGFTAGWAGTGSITGRIIYIILYNLLIALENSRFLNFIIQSDSHLKLFLIFWI